MFEWFVMNTKQSPRFHVVLGSSDSFFHLWVAKFIGSSVCSSYVIGDLTKEEANTFWLEKLLPEKEELLAPLPVPSFEDAYEVCKGNMFLLRKYLMQYILNEGKMENGSFSVIRGERFKLMDAYFYKTGDQNSFYAKTGKGLPLWNQQQLVELMKKITRVKSGFLTYDPLCKEMGKEVVDSFISHHLLHFRPTDEFAYDLEGVPKKRAVVTTETPAALIAMKDILDERSSW